MQIEVSTLYKKQPCHALN